jgi:hypothetical protein
MKLANDISPSKEALAKLQKTLISLLMDKSVYDDFVKSPGRFADGLENVPQIYKNIVASIDPDGLSTFRSIVKGTRQERFRQVFSILNSYVGDGAAWENIISEFLDKITVENGRDDSDLFLFEKFMRLRDNKFLGDLASIDCRTYVASNSPPIDGSQLLQIYDETLEVELHSSAQLLHTFWPIKDLINSNNIINHGDSKGEFYNIIYPNSNDVNLRVRALPAELGADLINNPKLKLSDFLKYKSDTFLPEKLLSDGCLVLLVKI